MCGCVLCGLTDKDNVYKYVIRTLQYEEIINEEAVVQTLLDRFISIAEVGVKTKFRDIMNAILAGDTVILIDNIQTAIVINSRAWEKRSLEPPVTEDLIRTESWIK